MTPAEYLAAMNFLLGLIKIIQSQKLSGQIPPAAQQALLDALDGVRAGLTAPLEPFEVVEIEIDPVIEDP